MVGHHPDSGLLKPMGRNFPFESFGTLEMRWEFSLSIEATNRCRSNGFWRTLKDLPL